MKKSVRIIILVLVVFTLVGIYYGKNIYGKSGNKAESESELQWTSFDSKIFEGEKPLPVILELGSPTCPPCIKLHSILVEAKNKYEGKVQIIKVNVEDDANLSTALRYKVRVMPTILFFNEEGVVKKRYEGLIDMDTIDKELKALGVQ